MELMQFDADPWGMHLDCFMVWISAFGADTLERKLPHICLC